MNKKRILIIGEFTELQTGYAVYLKNLMLELQKREDYEIAQFAMYAQQEKHREQIARLPWKVFCNLPNNEQEDQAYNSNPVNEFGGYKFDQVCLEFMPNCCIFVADPWMISWVYESPFKRFFQTIYMPPHDGYVGQDEWFGTYKQADHLLTYQDWSLGILKEAGKDLLNLRGSAPPQVNRSAFKLITDKKKHKEMMGLRPDTFIVGMVGRNQKRKLYPEICESLVKFMERLNYEGTKDVYAYFHLAFPDLGWNIPALLKDFGLSRKILFTYYCGGPNNPGCGFYMPSFYQDVNTICPRCHKRSMTFSNSTSGVSPEQLGTIYGLFDLYVQYTTLAGFEIPIIEAAACGVPVCGTDSTGLSDNVRKLGGYSIPVNKWILEAETRRYYPVPDNEALIAYIKKMVNLPEAVRVNLGMKCYENCMKHYGNWANTAKVWMDCIDQVPANDETWRSPPEIVPIPPGWPNEQQMNDEQFVNWLLMVVLRRPEWINNYGGLRFFRDLQWSRQVMGGLSIFAGDLSNVGERAKYMNLTRNELFNAVKGLRERYNNAEMTRWRVVQERMKK